MKIRDNLYLYRIGKDFIIIPMTLYSSHYPGFMSIDIFGVFLWNQLSFDTTIEKIVDKVIEFYDLDEETARRDVLAYIELFKKYNVLENV